jgi:hypothetical protein
MRSFICNIGRRFLPNVSHRLLLCMPLQVEFVQVNYVSFAEAIMELVGELYRATAKFPSVIHGHVLQHIIRVSTHRQEMFTLYLSCHVFFCSFFARASTGLVA